MPSDSLWVIVAVLAVFGFFTAAVVWADTTWRPRRTDAADRPASRTKG
jgi:hypothetical protein